MNKEGSPVKIGNSLLSGYEIIDKIMTGGSDRFFYRIKKGKKTYILIKDKNIKNYLKILTHLLSAKVGVPKLVEFKNNYAIVEDLGKNSLYELMHKGHTRWIKLYQMAIEELVKLQIDGYKNAPVSNYYDAEHIKWEQDYFKEFFLKQYCEIPDRRILGIEDDLKLLHKKVVEAIKPISNFLMHRDYQSQNIFVKNGKIRIIDFQSARIGPLTYDLVSLLRDAYVNIDRKSEEYLIEYYLICLRKRGININKDNFYKIYRFTAIQRQMQALGAFANLSLNKNKIHFKKFIPRGLELLHTGLEAIELSRFSSFISTIKQLNNCLTI